MDRVDQSFLVAVTIQTEMCATYGTIDQKIFIGGTMHPVTTLADNLIFFTPFNGSQLAELWGKFNLGRIDGVIALGRPAVFILMAQPTHPGIIIGSANKNSLVHPHLAWHSMGGMTGCTLHETVFIKGKYLWDFHVRGRRFINGMVLVIVDPGPGVSHTAIMTGIADLSLGHHLFRLIGNQFRASSMDKKGINPPIMTEGTLLGRTGITRCLDSGICHLRRKQKKKV